MGRLRVQRRQYHSRGKIQLLIGERRVRWRTVLKGSGNYEKKWVVGLAFKNLLRYKRRTLITASAIAFGLTMYIWIDSILTGAAEESVRNLRWYETADAMAAGTGYMDDRDSLPLGKSFAWEKLASDLEAAGMDVTPRITFGADMVFFRDPYPEDGNVPARIIAIDPIRDSTVFRLRDTLGEGRWLLEGEDGALIGRWFAEDIGASVAAPIIAVTETRDGYFQTIDLEIVGILDSPNPVINREGFYVSLDTADMYLEMDREVTSLYITWPGAELGINRSDSLVDLVEEAGLEYSPWDVQAADYVAVMAAEYSGSGTVIFLILIIAAVGISNTMLMAVYERSREIGMMRALGMADRKIRHMFLLESAGIGAVGSFIGILVGALVNIPLVKYGLDYSAIMRDSNFGYRMTGIFYGSWHWQGYLYALILGIGLAVLVAAVSTRRILRLDIPSSLRFN